MPLLMCPNCSSSMQTVNRSGVEFDMCPSCRGVWLDRGELEKILAEAREGSGSDFQARGDERQYQQRHDSDRDDSYRHGGGYGHKKKKSIFDIFD